MDNHTTAVTVVGLGAMGRAIARAALVAGHTTTVWNRTPERAEDLAGVGATAAPTIRDAFAASPVVIISVLDADAVMDVLRGTEDAIAGRTILDLTSTTPDDAARIHDAVTARGGAPLLGAVMGTPPMVGTDDLLVLVSGARELVDRVDPVMDAVAGGVTWVGEDPRAAALLDLSMLDVFYAGATAFVHGAALAATAGTAARDFLPFAQAMHDLVAATAVELAEELDAGRHPGDDNNLAMMLRGIEHVVEASEAAGLDPAVPQSTRRLMERAVAAGHGAEGYGRIVDAVRAPGRRMPATRP